VDAKNKVLTGTLLHCIPYFSGTFLQASLLIFVCLTIGSCHLGRVGIPTDLCATFGNRLTAAYLDAGAFSAAEFRKRKEESIGKKRTLLDSIAALDEEENQRFEPVIRFLNGSKQMKYVAKRGNPKELRESLEVVGSNLTVRDRRLHWEPRGAWKLVVDSGSFAQHNTAPGNPGAVWAGETHQISWEWSLLEQIRTFFKDNPSWT
jgi:hypothetical protein